MSRFRKQRRVLFVEEPVFSDEPARVEATVCPRSGVEVITPRLPEKLRAEGSRIAAKILGEFLTAAKVQRPIVWMYTPMAMDWMPPEISPAAVVYDCMDELTGFREASAQLSLNEHRLLQISDLVFTGGIGLFEVKRALHPRIYPFPGGVEVSHFAQARKSSDEPEDQRQLPRPRLGFAGPIDERVDLHLIREIAVRRPEWQLIMVGPVTAIEPDSLPRLPNIHWLGMKDYRELPAYFAGWDLGMLPFALNDATRFMNPARALEYLAAGLPVVSTPIRDVARSYGDLGLVRIAANADEFVAEAEQAMLYGMSLKWRERADRFLQSLSWESTWSSMNQLLENVLRSRELPGAMQPASQNLPRREPLRA